MLKETVQTILNQLDQTVFEEKNLHVFDVKIASAQNNEVALTGKVLQTSDVDLIREAILARIPESNIDTSNIRVLLNESTPIKRVSMNLSSMHAECSFQKELTTQMLWGDPIAILEANGDWALGRNMLDGYISWTYQKYLATMDNPLPTHMVDTKTVTVFSAPDMKEPLSLLFGGTRIAVEAEKNGMVKIQSNVDGWVALSDLIPLAKLPSDPSAQRNRICEQALSLIGVPYLWGGTSPFGIDCSGLVQWSYRMAGLQLRRDAQMQYDTELMVEPPYLPGDVILYAETKPNGVRSITHASISLGGTRVIHSSRSRNGVYIDDLAVHENLRNMFHSAIRYIQ